MHPLAALISDVHIDLNNLEETIEVLAQVLDYCEHHDIRRVILLGDVFTERTGQNMFALNVFLWFCLEFEERGIHLHMFPGNHDKVDQELKDSYLDVYGGLPNISLYNEESTLEIKDNLLCFLPFFPEDGSYIQRLSNIQSETKRTHKKRKFLFTHIAVNGVRNNDGSTVKSGLQRKLFSAFDRVYIGHYHDYQEVGANIIYIGSLRPQNYGENNEKGITILYPDGNIELVELQFPQYLKFTFDVSKPVKLKLAQKLCKKYGDSKDNIRFIFKGTPEQLSLVDKSEFERVGIEVKKESVVVNIAKSVEETNIERYDKTNIKRLFIRFCAENEVDSKKRKLGLKYVSQLKVG